MATRTQSRSSTRGSSGSSNNSSSKRGNEGNASSGRERSNGSPGDSRSRARSGERSAFSWGENGSVIGAALAGAAIGFAANYGRKLVMQGMEAAAGDWDVMLATEHEMALAIFDKMLATDETQTFKRKMLLMKLTHALDKHAHQEEMVVYPALREANDEVEADQLEVEHGHVKTYLYELSEMGPSASNWLETVREFRAVVSRHAHMEEEQVFPRFKEGLTEEQNARITKLVNKDGFWMA